MNFDQHVSGPTTFIRKADGTTVANTSPFDGTNTDEPKIDKAEAKRRALASRKMGFDRALNPAGYK